MRDRPQAREIARAFVGAEKLCAAICHGPWRLVSAGVIDGRRVTSFWGDGVPEGLAAAGGRWENADVVLDGSLVTSRWPPDRPAFTRAMMEMLDGRSDRGREQLPA